MAFVELEVVRGVNLSTPIGAEQTRFLIEGIEDFTGAAVDLSAWNTLRFSIFNRGASTAILSSTNTASAGCKLVGLAGGKVQVDTRYGQTGWFDSKMAAGSYEFLVMGKQSSGDANEQLLAAGTVALTFAP